MTNVKRAVLYGILLWVIPFVVAASVWDTQTNAPRMEMIWFSAIMAATWAVTYSIVICLYSKGVKWNKEEGWRTGIIWYLTVVILELVFIVGLFGTPLSESIHLLLTDAPNLIITVGIGYAASHMKK